MTTFNRRFADQISAHREAFAPPLVENPREGRVSGWQDGGYVVDIGGSRSVRQSATNGSIPVGGVACVRGRVDAQPAIAPQPKRPGVRVDVKAGPVKILFSVIDGSDRVYYVGGDRAQPKVLFRLPVETKAYPHLVVTGKGLNQFYWQYETDIAEYPSEAPFRYGSYVVDGRYPGQNFNLLSADSAYEARRSFGGGNTPIFPTCYIGDGQYALGTFDCIPPNSSTGAGDVVPNLLKLSIAHYQNGEVLDINGRGQFPLSWGVGTTDLPVESSEVTGDFTHFLPLRNTPLVTNVFSDFAPLRLDRVGPFYGVCQLLSRKADLGICASSEREDIGQYPGFYAPVLDYGYFQDDNLYTFLVGGKDIRVGYDSYQVVGESVVEKNNRDLIFMLFDFFNTTGVFKRLQPKFVSLDPAKKLGYFAYDFDFRRTNGNYDWGQNPNLIAGTKDVVNFKKLNFETIELEDLPVKIFPLKRSDASLQIHSISYTP